MLRTAATLAVLYGAVADSGVDFFAEQNYLGKNGFDRPCTGQSCVKPKKKYERIQKTPPGYQWVDHGGYCGSWSTQRAAMAKGAWISQQQVRDHTVPGGGNDNEVLDTNIDLALKNLKIKAEGFDFRHLPSPQLDAGRKFMKKHLAAGNPLVQMIMLPGRHYPDYHGNVYGYHSHVEAWIGIMSDKPLTDETFYDDDYIVHYNDNSLSTYYRSMQSLPGTYDEVNGSACPHNDESSVMCMNPTYVFSWAIQGFEDTREGLPISLAVDQWKSEPDTRIGDSPQQLTGTVTFEDLELGEKYALYRWDSVESAFDYSNPVSINRFTANSSTHVYQDPKRFWSNGTTYYRCIKDDFSVVV